MATAEPAEWAAGVADRNATGCRTALLVVASDLGRAELADLAERMAAEVFRSDPWQLIDARESA